jgi:hypothetical protein
MSLRAALALCALASPASADCRLALVLALDVSASVDSTEYRLQAEGTAVALMSPAVRAAVLADAPVALAAFLWSGAEEQVLAADWALVTDEAALQRFAGTLAGVPRPDFGGRTATGAALVRAAALLARAPACDRQVVDVSTDGIANDGVAPAAARALLGAVTVNALAVGGDLPFDHGTRSDEGGRLSAWLAQEVLHGPGAFVIAADDYRDFARAMARKLEREVRPLAVGAAP